jgi:hypothetical protein
MCFRGGVYSGKYVFGEMCIRVKISRVMSGHCSIRAHLERFRIVGDPICVCMINYETVDHNIWKCSRFEVERRQLLLGLAAVNIEEGTPIRDLCALQKWAALRLCHRFLRECGLKICFSCF